MSEGYFIRLDVLLLLWYLNTSDNEAEGTIIIYSFIEYICYDLKYIDVNHKLDCEWKCYQHNVKIPKDNDQNAHGWLYTVEVNYPFSRQFSQTEAPTHESMSWDFKLVVHG